MRLSTFELHQYASKYFEITEFQLPVSFDLLKEESRLNLSVDHGLSINALTFQLQKQEKSDMNAVVKKEI